MVRVDDDAEIPESGAVFTFGKSKFADNVPSKFWIRSDVIKSLACGDEHSISVTGNGRVYVFGSNEWGQLGVVNKKTVTKPYCLKALKQEKATNAAGGRAHTIITTDSGKVYSFGGNSEGQLGLSDDVSRPEPTVIEGLEGPMVSVAAGSYHTVLLNGDGVVYVFGSNSEGQLGLGDVEKVPQPTKLQLDVPIKAISCGYYHTALVTKDGKVLTFGEKDSGKLGLLEKQLMDGANKRPQCIFSIAEKVGSVSCGGNHTAVVTECGKLYTFGSGLNGQLGLGTMIMEAPSPSLVGALNTEKIVSASCGESHTAIITDQGKIYTCGDGRHGKLGLGDENFSNQFSPIVLKKFLGYSVAQVACGGCHMLVLASKSNDSTVNNDSDVTETTIEDNIRNRRRLKDQVLKPLPPLGSNNNLKPLQTETETPKDEDIPDNDGDGKDRLDVPQLNAADAINGNYTQPTPEVTSKTDDNIISNLEQIMENVTSSPMKVQPTLPSPAKIERPEPAERQSASEKIAAEIDRKESGSSGSSSSDDDSDDDEGKVKPNQFQCQAVVEVQPSDAANAQPSAAEVLSIPVVKSTPDENVTENLEEKKGKKKFWNFSRKKSLSKDRETNSAMDVADAVKDEVETAAAAVTTPIVTAVVEKVPTVASSAVRDATKAASDKATVAVTEKKPLSSIFGRSSANKADGQQNTSTNKSSACNIV
ncbi:hypothetical protein CHUAL_000215 [Chamberlinius hualienensis]